MFLCHVIFSDYVLCVFLFVFLCDFYFFCVNAISFLFLLC
jgi:hypothetical protein